MCVGVNPYPILFHIISIPRVLSRTYIHVYQYAFVLYITKHTLVMDRTMIKCVNMSSGISTKVKDLMEWNTLYSIPTALALFPFLFQQ